jgi:PAS domain S-box-containing protein
MMKHMIEIDTFKYPKKNEIAPSYGIIKTDEKTAGSGSVQTILRNENEKYKNILEGIEDGYFEVDLAGNFTFFNSAMCRMLGYSSDELMGMNNRQFMDSLNAKTVFNTFNQVYKTGKSAKAFDWELITKDGEKRIVETSVSLQIWENHAVKGFMGIARDITKSKQMELALKKSEESYRLLLESLPDPIVLYDLNGNVLYSNPSFEATFGWSSEELARNHIDFVPEENRPETMTAIKKVLKDETVKLFETKRLTKTGKLLDVQLSVSSYLDKDGKLSGIVAILRDISDIKRTKEDLQRTHEQLKKAYEDLKVLDKAKERVINHLSHELQTPLALISGVFGKISRELGKANITGLEKTINRGKRNVDRLLDLQAKIDDILNRRSLKEKEKIISLVEDAASFLEELKEEGNQHVEMVKYISERVESLFRAEEIHMETIRLNSILNDICDETIGAMNERKVRIIRNFEKKEFFIVMDRNIVQKTFLGLLKNAIENTPDEGKIKISMQSRENTVRIDIKDYGVGISSENKKMIFGGFFHTQDTGMYSSKRPYAFNAGGSGADLLRAKCFAERYGFSIDFDSKRCRFIPNDTDICPGMISSCPFAEEQSACYSSGGSTFSVTFPLEKNTEQGLR